MGISVCLHQEAFEHGDFDASTVEGQQALRLHFVEGDADVEAAVVQFFGHLLHKDVEGLGTGRVEAA